MIILETQRLILRRLTLEDAPFMLTLLNTASWLKYIGDRGVRTLEDARNYLLNGTLKSYEDNGFGFYLAVLKENNAPLGTCGLIKRDFLEDIDIGFALLPEYEGKGFGYEAASAVITYARDTLGISRIAAITTSDNHSSQNLLKKIGLQYERMVRYPGEEEELMLFTDTPSL